MTIIAHSTTRIQPTTRRFHLALMLLVGAALSIGTLEFLARATHTMRSHTLSELFYAPGGALLFPTGAVLLAAALFIWGQLLVRARARTLAALALGGAVALLAAAIFPTDPTGTTILSWPAQVHRYGAGFMFLIVPITGLLQARRASRR